MKNRTRLIGTASLGLLVFAAVGPREGLNAGPPMQASSTRGAELFDQTFHESTGLGAPEMNADSCRACHQDPIMGGAGPLELNVTRFAKDNGGAGPFEDLPGGQGLSKLFPPFIDGREEHPVDADVFEQRQTPSIVGDGFIDGIPDSEIIANEDPDDLDGDGITGVARLIDVNGIMEVGKFGWKAQVPRLADFVNDAMGGELGITTPDNGRGFALLADNDGFPDPEITQQDVDDIAAFMAGLPAPRRGGSTDPNVFAGQVLFQGAVGCARCHIPSLLGGDGQPVPLYSDLLLHNVMPDDYRGMSEAGAGVGEFKTPPLWGIRKTAPYMHDGRAEDLDGAIRAHFGEADLSRTNYEALTPSEQDALILFLEDL